jgi:hypothetical protein
MERRRNTAAMNSIGPIALAQSTDLVRRAVRGAGPDGADAVPAAPERPRSRWTLLRLNRRRAATANAAHPASDQGAVVAAPRRPARA